MNGIEAHPFLLQHDSTLLFLLKAVTAFLIAWMWIQGVRRYRQWEKHHRQWRCFRRLARNQGLESSEIAYLLYLAQTNALRSPVRLRTDSERFGVLYRLTLSCEQGPQLSLLRSIQRKLFSAPLTKDK